MVRRENVEKKNNAFTKEFKSKAVYLAEKKRA